MNTTRIPLFSQESSQPSAPNRTCPHPPFWSQVSRSRLSTVDSRLPSNRDSKSSQKMLSTSKFSSSNFLIGTLSSLSRTLPVGFMTIPKSLEFSLTRTKHSTSHFLIDNFRAGFASLDLPTSNLELPTSSSNRPSPRLETLVSHRKQTVGPISNRPQFALCNSLICAPDAPMRHAFIDAQRNSGGPGESRTPDTRFRK